MKALRGHSSRPGLVCFRQASLVVGRMWDTKRSARPCSRSTPQVPIIIDGDVDKLQALSELTWEAKTEADRACDLGMSCAVGVRGLSPVIENGCDST